MSNLKTKHSSFKKSALACAVAMAIGSTPLQSDIYTFSFSASGDGAAPGTAGSGDGLFTMLDPLGVALQNSSQPYASDATWSYGFRTQISGSFTFDTSDNSGSATFAPFQFFNGDSTLPATASGVAFTSAGNDTNTGNPLVLANMLFDWNGNDGIPVALVWDIKGLIDGINAGLLVGDAVTGGTLIASNDVRKGKIPVAASPVAMTTWDATDACTVGATPMTPPPGGCMTVNPIGALPLIADTLGGDPMVDGPFTNFNANFDIAKLTLTAFQDDTPPVIALNGSNPTNLNVGDTYTELATCNDPANPANPSGVNLTGSMVIGGGPVDTSAAATFTLTYDCTDGSGNSAAQQSRTVNVTALGTPSITLLGNNPATHEAATTYTDAGATCDDGSGGNIPLPTNNPPELFQVQSTTVNENVPGTYAVTYECTNSSGVSAVDVTRTVNVQDTTPPVITLTPACGTGSGNDPDAPITFIADGTDPTPTATAVDTVDGALTVTQTGSVNPNPSFGNQTSITFNLGFSATDAASNPSVSACDVILGNPDPVATLLGNATEVVDPGAGYTDPGATCDDFVDGALPNATADTVIDANTPNGTYTITYTCGPNSAGRTGTTTRSVVVGAPFSAADDSGSAFSMLDPTGSNVGGADDIFFSWTGQVYTPSTLQSTPNMFMGSAAPQPFFGSPWVAHDIRALGPGSYTFTTSRGGTLQLDVGENQIGAHMLFDWSGNNDIDVVLAWDINGVFVGSPGTSSDDQGSKGDNFGLASVDPDGDGLPGVPMADGPFAGFNANFNIKITPQFALPDASATTAQGPNDPTSIIVSTTDPVTVTASVNPDVNGVYTYAGPFTYDWSASDATVLGVNTNGTTSSTFAFNPSTLADGAITVVGKVTDGATGLTSTVTLPLQVVTGNLTDPNVQDSDSDGIPDSQDSLDNTATPTVQQVVSSNGTTFLAESSAGTLTLGDIATNVGVASGVYQLGVLASDIPVTDSGVSGSCAGGCFSFKVSGLTAGSTVDVVLPLDAAIPSNAGLRKFVNGTWRDFVVAGNNLIMSAPGSLGSCPAPGGTWSLGLNPGDFCVKLSIVDGGPNDADGVANGTVVDPSGVSGASTGGVAVPAGVGSASTGGCTLGGSATSLRSRLDWLAVAGLLGWLGFGARRRGTRR